MIYTAIFQNSVGTLSHETYRGHSTRSEAWLDAAQQGGASDKCLVALIPGDHPVYFYSDFVGDQALETHDTLKKIDLFDLN